MKRILVVDDEPHVRRIIEMTLQREGYSVVTASDGQKGLESIRQEMPDAMVVDIDMPVMNGKEMCLAFYEEFPDNSCPIFISTSRTEDEFRELTEMFQAVSFLEKPLSTKVLSRALSEVLGS